MTKDYGNCKLKKYLLQRIDYDVIMNIMTLCPVLFILQHFNHLRADPTKWSHLNNSSTAGDELFECVWPLSGVGAKGLNSLPTKLPKSKKELTKRFLAVKGALSGLRQFLTTESPLKIMKKAFYFTWEALFVLKIIKFLSYLFGHESKRLD